METIRKTLRDSKSARWIALAVVSFTMLCGYYLTDVMAPLKPLLEKSFSGTAPNMDSLQVHTDGSMCSS
jgi:hypothetical protein